MTIVEAIQKKKDNAIRWALDPAIGIGAQSGHAPGGTTREEADNYLLLTSDSYRALDEIQRFARGEISDVTPDW